MFPLNLILELVPTELVETGEEAGQLKSGESGLLGHVGTVGGPTWGRGKSSRSQQSGWIVITNSGWQCRSGQ